MKKIYTLIAAAALAIGGISYAAVGDVALQSDFSKAPADGPGTGETWTKVNGGEGTSASATFMTNSAAGHGDDSAYRLWTATEGLQNDWLVSPKLALETGKTYEVSCWIRMSNADSKVGHVALHHTTVYPTIDGQNSNILPSAALEQYNDVTGTSQNANEDATLFSYTKLSGKFVAAEGDNYVALHVSGTCYRGVIVSDFKVVEATGSTDPVTPIDPDPEQPGDHTCVEGVVNVPYASAIATSNSTYDEAWTVINANENTGTPTWTPATESNFTGMKVNYSTSQPVDDYLISPAIHLEKGTEYIISYDFATYYADELLSVYLTESMEPADIKASTPIAEHLKVNTKKKPQNNTLSLTPEKTGDYHLTFYGHTPTNKWWIMVGNVKVLENVFAPGAVTNLTATPAENPTLEVALAWALPTVDQFGGEMGEDKVFEKVEIYRDEEERPIATITDKEAATSFTDSEATGLTSGKHTYSVVVTYNGAASPAAKVGPTAYVGPFEVLALPADMTFAADMKGAWKQAYGEGHPEDANKWETYSSSNPDRWQFVAKRNSTCDAWLFSPEFNIPAPGFYDFTLDAINGSTYTKTYAHSYLSTTQDLNGARTELPFNWTNVKGGSTTLKATVYVAEAGTYSIATGVVIDDASLTASSAFNHAIKGWKVAQGQMIPKEATNLQAKAADDESLSIKVSWTNPTENTANTALEAGQWYVKVWRSDAGGRNYAVIATLTNGESEYTDNELPESGAYYYMVQTLATADDATNTESNPATLSSWAGSRELAMPYSVRMNSSTGENASRYIWEAIDANKDGKTWGFGIENTDRMECAEPATEVEGEAKWYKYEDYLLSPIFTLSPGYYQLDFQMYGQSETHYVNQESNKDMSMNVGLCGAGQFLPERPELIGKTLVSNNSTSYKNQTVIFQVEEFGKYQIVFAADVKNYKKYRLPGLGLVEFKGKDVLPRAATELSVEPGADGALTALVKWTNPTTTNIEGVTPELTKAEIYRDTELIATIEEGLVPGEQSEWLDEAALAGKHTYAVRMYTAGGAQQDADASVVSPWIGNGLEAPYSVEPGNYERDGWEHHSPNQTISSGYPSNCFVLTTSNGARYDKGNKSVDGYLMSPNLEFNERDIYKLTVTAWKTYMNSDEETNGYPIDILVGMEGTPDSWTKLGTIRIKSFNSSATAVEFYIKGEELAAEVEPEEGVEGQADEAEPTEPGTEEPTEPEQPAEVGTTQDSAVAAGIGTHRLAFHISQDYNNGLFMFNKFAIEKVGETTGIESIGVAGGVVLEGGKLFFEGTAEDVRIYDLAGKLVRFAEEAEGSISLEGLAKGVYVVRFSLEGEAVAIKLAR